MKDFLPLFFSNFSSFSSGGILRLFPFPFDTFVTRFYYPIQSATATLKEANRMQLNKKQKQSDE